MARILVVDDERNIREAIRLALQHVGHVVETASDGPEGLAEFGDGRKFDLVLLDHRMQGITGLDVLREMRRREPTSKLIMITAFGTVNLAVDAMKAGATDFLRKPFTSDVLRGAVRAALDESQTAREEQQPEADGITYGMTTLNGYRIESHPNAGQRVEGDVVHAFVVRSPDGVSRKCTACLPAYVVELVKARADREQMPGGPRFWQALCEEVLANFLWQNSQFPPDDTVIAEEFSTNLQRWVDAVLSASLSRA